MDKVPRRLLLFHLLTAILWQVGGVNFGRLIELSQHIRHCDDIRSLVVFSQRSFVQGLSGYEMFLRCQSSALPVVLIGDDYTGTESLGSLLGSWSLVFVFMDTVENADMLAVVNRSLLHIHSSKMVFVLEEPTERVDEALSEFFKKCLHLGIVNAVVMWCNQIISYEPFPTVSLTNLTLSPIEEYFQDHLYDLKGYTFYSPIHQDAARVFIYNDTDGQTRISGVNTEIYRSFVQRHNATFQRLLAANNKISEITDGFTLLAEGKIDILMHSFSYFNPKSSFAWSYPIAQIQWQAVVPFVGEISPYKYLILPFNRTVWICLAGSFLYISVVGYITLRYCRRVAEYGSVFSRSLTQFLYMPSTGTECNLRAFFFDMQIFCYGLIFTNVYLAFLSAFLTTTVQGKQIDTLDELYASGIKIMTTTFESTLINHTDVFRPQYNDIFRIEEMDLINEYRKRLDRTFAFVMAEDRTNFFLGQQKYLEKKRWHVSKKSLGTYFLSFSMQPDSPFRKNFDAILLQLYQTGLYTKWGKDVFDLAVATKYLRLFRSEDEDSFRPLTISHLLLCWITFAVGIGVAFAVLLLEFVRFRTEKCSRTVHPVNSH